MRTGRTQLVFATLLLLFAVSPLHAQPSVLVHRRKILTHGGVLELTETVKAGDQLLIYVRCNYSSGLVCIGPPFIGQDFFQPVADYSYPGAAYLQSQSYSLIVQGTQSNAPIDIVTLWKGPDYRFEVVLLHLSPAP